MGDRLPSELLDHIRGLLPDPRYIYEIVFLDTLPASARNAALQHSDLDDMAAAADRVVLENRASNAATPRPSVNAFWGRDGGYDMSATLDAPASLPPPLTPVAAAVTRGQRPPAKQSSKPDSLCPNHKRYGKDTYKCSAPDTCKMRHILSPNPRASAAASGNAPAGGQ